MESSDFRTQFTSAMENLSSLSSNVEKQLRQLEEKEKSIAKLGPLMDSTVSTAKQKIVLNIGGKKFATSRSTLLSVKNSFFYAMLCSEQWKPDEDGEYFIDRNPKQFDRILDFLRHGELNLEDLTESEIKKIKFDMDYYLITMPVDLVQTPNFTWDSNKKHPLVVLTDGVRASVTASSCNHHSVLGKTSYSTGIVSWTILLSAVACYDVIGICTNQSTFQLLGAGSWGLLTYPGSHNSTSSSVQRISAPSMCKAGDVVKVEVNFPSSTVQFYINGASAGSLKFNTTQPIYPFLTLCNNGNMILQ